MGAYVGAVWACGYDGVFMEKLAREVESRWGLLRLIDPAFPPRRGFLRGTKVRERLQFSIGEAHFGDLVRPLRVVATNLFSLERRVFDSGDVARAVQASSAIPGVCQPVPSETPGELVFTPLDARGTVVLRYRTGDIIDGGLTYGPCPNCGRQLPRLVGNISRAHLRSSVAFLPLDESAAARGVGIRGEVDPRGICTLTFDRPGSSANVLDRETLLEFEEHLNFVAQSQNIRALIITSAKESIFIAGADLNALAGMADHERAPGILPGETVASLNNLVALGQRIFNQLASLQAPTLAAIHGACLGGGFELALACDYRIATNDRATKIGLPETQLGILPAWGGCTRLPRLIGLRRATEFVLAGKPADAKRALKLGLINEAVPRKRLLDIALRRVTSVERLFPARAREKSACRSAGTRRRERNESSPVDPLRRDRRRCHGLRHRTLAEQPRSFRRVA